MDIVLNSSDVKNEPFVENAQKVNASLNSYSLEDERLEASIEERNSIQKTFEKSAALKTTQRKLRNNSILLNVMTL